VNWRWIAKSLLQAIERMVHRSHQGLISAGTSLQAAGRTGSRIDGRRAGRKRPEADAGRGESRAPPITRVAATISGISHAMFEDKFSQQRG